MLTRVFPNISLSENVLVAVIVTIDHFPLFQIGFFDLVSGTVGLFHTGTGDHVFHLAAVKSGTFSGFAEIKFGDYPRCAVNFDLEALFKVGSVVHS